MFGGLSWAGTRASRFPVLASNRLRKVEALIMRLKVGRWANRPGEGEKLAGRVRPGGGL